MAAHVHRIRLHGPWHKALAQPAEPEHWEPFRFPPLQEFAGQEDHGREQVLLLRRRFHRPTGLTSREQLFLVLENWPEGTQVSLNGRLLGHVTGPRQRFSTPELTFRNELLLRLPLANARRWPNWAQAAVLLEIVAKEDNKNPKTNSPGSSNPAPKT